MILVHVQKMYNIFMILVHVQKMYNIFRKLVGVWSSSGLQH